MTKIQELLHKLWTKAIGTQDYNKKEWQELETLAINLENELNNTCFECGIDGGEHRRGCWQEKESE